MMNHNKATESKVREDCYPIVTVEDAWDGMNEKQQKKMETYRLKQGVSKADIIANPCGLAPLAMFDGENRGDGSLLKQLDTFEIEGVTISEKDIAWQSDIKVKFNRADDYSSQWRDVTDGTSTHLHHRLLFL